MRAKLLKAGDYDHRDRTGPVVHGFELNADALAGLTIVRRFQLANLCDRDEVIGLVAALGCHEGAGWLHANRHLYSLALGKVEAMIREAATARVAGGS